MSDKVRKTPCPACPYRRDVPSGVWEAHEYEKLRAYDAETFEQPFAAFGCHATPEHYCHGWAVVHTSRGHEHDLIALRVNGVDGEIPPPAVPLFASGAEAAEHGLRDLEHPGPEARAAQEKLRRYPRLRGNA